MFRNPLRFLTPQSEPEFRPSSPRAGRALTLLASTLLLVAGLAVRIHNIDLPGPYADEVIVPAATKHFLAQDQRPSFAVTVAGIDLPLSFSPHTGALVIYVDALCAVLTKQAAYYYRYETILFCLVSTALFFILVKRLLGVPLALLGVTVLAFMPSYVFYSRIAQHSLFLRNVFSAPLLLLLFSWVETRSVRAAYSAAFLAGLGMSYRLEIGWMGIGLLFLVAFDRETREVFVAFLSNLKGIAISGVFFLLGFSIVIVNQIVNDFPLVRQIARNQRVTLYGHENLDFVTNLSLRLRHVADLFRGDLFRGFGTVASNPLWVSLLVVGFVVALLLALGGRGSDKTLARRLLLFSTPILIVSCFSVTSLVAVHLLFLIYLPLLMLLLSLRAATRSRRGRMFLAGPLVTAVVAAVVIDIRNDFEYHMALEKTGGIGLWSNGLMNAVDLFRDKLPAHRILVGSWGIKPALDFFLPRGRYIREVFGYSKGYQGVPSSFYEEINQEIVGGTESAFVFFTHDEGGFVRKQAFIDHLDSLGVDFRMIRLPDQQGRPLLDVMIPEHVDPRMLRGVGAGAELRMPERGDLELLRLYPPKCRVGERFNKQPDGGSALALQLAAFRPGERYLVSVGGRTRPATVGENGLISVRMGDRETASPGRLEVFVITTDLSRRSNSLILRVRAPVNVVPEAR